LFLFCSYCSIEMCSFVHLHKNGISDDLKKCQNSEHKKKYIVEL